MNLVLYNGSPRGKESNSMTLINQFVIGLEETGIKDCQVHHLAAGKRLEEHLKAFQSADAVLLFLPLYTDAMPAVVMRFIEALPPGKSGEGKKMGFVIQSGFREPVHSDPVAEYFRLLCRSLGAEFLGSVVRGGSEGLRMMPPFMTKKPFAQFQKLGRVFGETGKLDEVLIRKIRGRLNHFGPFIIFLFRLITPLGLTNMYWNQMMKKNRCYQDRFARPYAPAEEK